MITKTNLFESIVHETNVCKHLHAKLSPEALDYRPTPGQRSTLELLRYLAAVGVAAMTCMVDGQWSAWGSLIANTAEMTGDEFPAAMDRQTEDLRRIFESISDEEFASRTAIAPWRELMTLELGVLNLLFKWMVAYKMQLFLYAKATGVTAIGTSNAWMGVDMPQRTPPDESGAA